ncbi:unnamed protein product [[Candida] boidinii]|nr:unnamed protein product [[Candida] boidinii]
MIMNQKKNINECNNHNNKNHNSGNNNNNNNSSSFNIIPSCSSNSNSNSNSNKFNNIPYHNSIPNRTRNNSYKQSHQFERPIFKKPLLKTVRSSLNNSNLQNNFNTKYTQNITNDNRGFNPINQNQLQYQNQFNSDTIY